ncbi:MAG: hypothetical protein FJZ01_03175 [Candidatus Sericytochromatia bacterium]|nr:hypothetical protein [Candidatus Tanganyikabacteria bacterium]
MANEPIRVRDPGQVVARPRRDGAGPPKGDPPGGQSPPAPKLAKDELELSSAAQQRLLEKATGATAAGVALEAVPLDAEVELPVISADQLNDLVDGEPAASMAPNPGMGQGNEILKDFKVVGYAIDTDAWNRMGRPEGFIPIAYLATHLDVGKLGAEIRIKSRFKENGDQKVSLGVKNITWEGQKVEKLAKEWAIKWAKEHPEQAIPAGIVIVAGGLVGAYYYSKKTGPVEFSAGSIKLVKYKGFEAKLKPKAEIDVDPWSLKVNGLEGQVSYKFPDDRQRIEAGARYNFEEERWRFEAHYGIELGKKGDTVGPTGYAGVGVWAEQVDRRLGRDEDWDYGAGVYLGLRF